MNRRYIDMTQKEREHQNCSALFDEIKERLQKLRDSGISDSEIASLFNVVVPLKKLIVSRNYKLFLGDERVEIKMEPIVKAVFLLFLKHPEGINFKDLPDYREELTKIYDKVRPWGLTDRALRSIEDVTNPFLNSINEKCARIRKVFASMLDSSIADQYYIRGKRGNAKAIALPRELVVWE